MTGLPGLPFRILGLLAALALAGCAARPGAPSTTIYLVRHAETVASAVDPDRPLNERGRQRAMWLADYFTDRALGEIYSTPLTRTLQTVAPVAADRNIAVAHYDPRRLPALAAELREARVPTLVAGHSNTTPALLNLLLGDDRYEQLDDAEHSLIFIVILTAGEVQAVSVEHSQAPPST